MNVLCWMFGHKWEKHTKTIYNHGCIPASEVFEYEKCSRCYKETEWVEA